MSGKAENLAGTSVIAGNLTVTFTRTTYIEHHPYGSTYATETLTETTNETYFLNDHPITREDLNKLFGEEEAERAIQEAIDNAE